MSIEERIIYRLGGMLTLEPWWQPLLLGAVAILSLAYAIAMYRRDGVELSRPMTLSLLLLRLGVFLGIGLFFLGPERSQERLIRRESRALVLIDSSASMQIQDSNPSSGSTGNGSRFETAISTLGDGVTGDLVAKLRERHDVSVLRFDDQAQPKELAQFKRIGGDPKPLQAANPDKNSTEISGRIGWLAWIVLAFFTFCALATIRGLTRSAPAPSAVLASGSEKEGLLTSAHSPSAAQELATVRAARPRGSWWAPVTVLFGMACAILFAAADLARTEFLTSQESALPIQASPDSTESAPPDWRENVTSQGSQTRLGDAISTLALQERGGSAAGVILFTDGASNAGRDPRSAAAALADAGIPLYVFGLGSPDPKVNLRVLDVEAPAKVFPGDKFKLTTYVQGIGTKEQDVEVELFAVGEGAGTEAIPLDQSVVHLSSSGVREVTFEQTPPKEAIGFKKYQVRIKPHSQEIDLSDNERTIQVELTQRKLNVLLMASGPMRDFVFLRSQLFRDRDVSVSVWLQSGQANASQEATTILDQFPKTLDELYAYDAIVAFDPNWDELDEVSVAALEKWVAEQAGGLTVVAGPIYTPEWTSRRDAGRLRTIRQLLPVSFFNFAGSIGLGRFGGETAYSARFTPDGAGADFLRVAETDVENDEGWKNLGGFFGFFAVKDVKPGGRILMQLVNRDGGAEDATAYMASQFFGAGRVVFLASGEMWRLRGVREEYFEAFYTKLLRWTSEGRLQRDSQYGILLVDKNKAQLGESIAVRAVLVNAQHEPYEAERVEASVVRPDGFREPLVLERLRDGSASGAYVAQWTPNQDGDFRIELVPPAIGDVAPMTRDVRVRASVVENESPERKDDLLKEIASISGGEFYPTIESGMGKTTERSTPVWEALAPREVIDRALGQPDRWFDERLMTWILGWLVTCLCMEWTMRRLVQLA